MADWTQQYFFLATIFPEAPEKISGHDSYGMLFAQSRFTTAPPAVNFTM